MKRFLFHLQQASAFVRGALLLMALLFSLCAYSQSDFTQSSRQIIKFIPLDSLTSTSIIDSILFDRWVRKHKIDTITYRTKYDSLYQEYAKKRWISAPLRTRSIVPTLSFDGISDKYSKSLDSLASEERSEEFYDSLQSKAGRNLITRNLYSWLVRSPSGSAKQLKAKSTDYFERFDGKIIGSVRLQQIDIFGPSVSDTTVVTTRWLGRVGNSTHVKTREKVLRKNLFFKRGQLINPNLMAENERHLRNLSYIKDVNIIIVPRFAEPELVDIVVITQDRFSYTVNGSISSTSKFSVGAGNKNVLGRGHEIKAKYRYNREVDQIHGVEVGYRINNLAGEFWDWEMNWNNTYRYKSMSSNLSKDFISNEAQYAGGFKTDYTYERNFIDDNREIVIDTMISYLNVDGWYGRSFPLVRSTIQTDNMVMGVRGQHYQYFDRPVVTQDTNRYFYNRELILGSVAFSRQNLYRNNKVYGYGITEDIPYGFYMEWISGFEHNDFYNRFYTHFFISRANILPMGGYFFWCLGGGGFFNSKDFEQGMFELKTRYFSRTFYIGNKDVRQFFNMNYVHGINRLEQDNLFFDSDTDIRGFSPTEAIGTQKLTFQTETVFYHKKSFYDFQFSSYFFLDGGFIGDDKKPILRQDFYSGIGLGLRIRNESLVFDTFEVRLAFYPKVPNDINNFSSSLFGEPRTDFQSFQGRKPEILSFD